MIVTLSLSDGDEPIVFKNAVVDTVDPHYLRVSRYAESPEAVSELLAGVPKLVEDRLFPHESVEEVTVRPDGEGA